MTAQKLKYLLYIVRIEGMHREFSVTIPFPGHLDAAEAASLAERTGVLGNTLNHKFGLVPDLRERPWDILDRIVIDEETNHLMFGDADRPTNAAGIAHEVSPVR